LTLGVLRKYVDRDALRTRSAAAARQDPGLEGRGGFTNTTGKAIFTNLLEPELPGNRIYAFLFEEAMIRKFLVVPLSSLQKV
jgi:hypothetical protein